MHKITRPRVRIEARLVVDHGFSQGFTLVRYEQCQANARWWQRTVTATDDQWLRLSGRSGTSPANAWSTILGERSRPVLPLPMLVLGDFVAYMEDQVRPETWHFFHWVVWGLDDLLRFSPLPPSRTGEVTDAPESIHTMTHALIDAVLDGSSFIPWPIVDGVQLQTLIYLGELIWSFPASLVRRFVTTMVVLNERNHGHKHLPPSQQITSPLVGPGQLLQLSGIHLWRTQLPHVRQLSLRMSAFAFPALLQQALILTHPDAPSVQDADLAHLCNGTIGYESDPPAPVQPRYNDAVNLPEFSPILARARIAAAARELAIEAATIPVGQWDIPTSSRFPLFRAIDLRAIRILATPEGCWVRLLPYSEEWGKVLWWKPQIDPPACLAFALGTGREHALVWAVHETIWMLWRDLRISGTPDR